uniref:Uncharacterized protein n=1 Tax=Anopheles atroparvus TaxID=41427 RepID=A0AAG5DSI9_ANOAO
MRSSESTLKTVKEEVFLEYCAGSSIHGVRYFDSTERTSCERFWWIIVFSLSMIGCGTMIYKTYTKWDQNPIIVSFSEKTTPVSEIQFPSVTICPETKVSTARLNFTAEINALDVNRRDPNSTLIADTIGKLKVFAQVCGPYFFLSNSYLENLNGTDENEFVNTLRKISVSRHKVLQWCVVGWKSCNRYLKETVTENGLCYSFNMLPQDKIMRQAALHNDYTYMKDWDEDYDEEPFAYPFHAISGLTQGYKLMLHEAGEYPQVSKYNIRIPLGHEMSIAVKPQIITTSQSAADYHWSKRQCFFDNERHLRFFRIYNQENCELECLTNITLASCGCVRFSMPRAHGTDVCSLDKWNCMHVAHAFFRGRPFSGKKRFGVTAPDQTTNAPNNSSECNCLPACSSTQYDVELAGNHPDRVTMSKVAIFFKKSHIITSRRSELYGMVDFLANCGGLLGLFMGVSILSLLEICYYITMRPFSLRKKKERRRSNREAMPCRACFEND